MPKNIANEGGRVPNTVAPVEVSSAKDTDPEFLDATGLQARFGIRRSLAYCLIADGAIKSVSLRRRGHVRGKRLFDVASVRAYLTSQMQQAPAEAENR